MSSSTQLPSLCYGLANLLELDLNVIMPIIIANICFCDGWVGPLGSMIKTKLLIGVSLSGPGTDTKSIDVYNFECLLLYKLMNGLKILQYYNYRYQ